MAYQGAPFPGPTPNYAPQNAFDKPPSDPPVQPYSSDVKDPYTEGRFKPKKKINDPIFLVLFVATVSIHVS